MSKYHPREWLLRRVSDPTTVVVAVVVAVAIAVGVALRYRYYTGIEPGPDSDEAEFALLAQQLLRGEWPLLMRGQPYGGTPWLFGIAASIRVFGMNAVGLRLPTVFLGLVNAAMSYGIGIQLNWSRRRAALAAAAVWCFPMSAVFFASRETMYFVPSVTAGLATIFIIARMERRRTPAEILGSGALSRRSLFVAGIAAGVGLWINPGSLYLTAPALIWIGWRALAEARSISGSASARVRAVVLPGLQLLGGLVLGAFPFLFLTLAGTDRRNNYTDRVGYGFAERVELLSLHQLPGWFGFRVPIGGLLTGAWLGGVAWKVAFVVFLCLLIFQVARRSAFANESLLSVLAIGVPIVFLVITLRTGPIYANLRYIFFASPILGLLLAAKWRSDLQAAAAIALLPLIALAGLLSVDLPRQATAERTAQLLEARGAKCAIGDYWAGGHRLMFETEGKIVSISTYENRNPLYLDQAEDLGNCPWVFAEGSPGAAQFEQYLQSKQISVESVRPGDGLVVYFPERRVWLEELFPDSLAGG